MRWDIGDHVSDSVRGDRGYPVARFFLAYLAALVVFSAVSSIAERQGKPGLALGAYVVCGIALNLYILRRVRWHFLGSTVNQMALAKLTAFAFWPFSYLLFLLKLLWIRLI